MDAHVTPIDTAERQAKIQALKAKHGKIFSTTLDKREIFFRRASAPEFEKFMATSSEPKDRVPAMRDLCVDCVLDPSPDEFSRLLDEMPGYAPSLTAKILSKSGLVEAGEVKEL